MHRDDVRRGEVYWVDWSPGRGSEQAGRRPALVVSADAGNHNGRYPLVIVAAISTAMRDILTHVVIEPTSSNGLTQTSSIKCEQLMTISKDRLRERLGRITEDQLASVDVALQRSLGIR